MSKMHHVILPVALFVSALALSGCASEPKVEPVAAPVEMTAPVEAPAPVAAPEPAFVPEVVAEQPAPKPVVIKAKRKAAKPKAAPPAPVAAPAPVVVQPAPAMQPEPAPAVTVAPLEEAAPEAGFFEQYWLWLVGLIIAIVGIVIWRSTSKPE